MKGKADYLYIDFFVSPLPLMAVILMAVNDHFFKYVYHSAFTGKLSDFLGLFFFPLLLAAAVSLFQNYLRRPSEVWLLNSNRLLACIAISSLVFVTLKVHTPSRDLVVELFQLFGVRIQILQDKTDLIALTSNVPCYFFGRRFFKSSS
jgi:hypothetical protein